MGGIKRRKTAFSRRGERVERKGREIGEGKTAEREGLKRALDA